MTSADPRFVDITNELADAVVDAVPGWFDAVARRHLGTAGAPERWALDVAEAATRIEREIRALADIDIDAQRTTPLTSIRTLAAVATPLLRLEGVAQVTRDPHAVSIHPDDVFDLTPGGFADLGDRVQAAGLAWGAAKAHLHLRRRRKDPS